MNPDVRVMRSFVWHGDDCYYVSTINRDSSAMLACGRRYAETLVWAYNYDSDERIGDVMHGAEFLEGSIHGHIVTCQRLLKTGSPYEPEEP